MTDLREEKEGTEEQKTKVKGRGGEDIYGKKRKG